MCCLCFQYDGRILKLEVTRVSRLSVNTSIYVATRHHLRKYSNFCSHRLENLRLGKSLMKYPESSGTKWERVCIALKLTPLLVFSLYVCPDSLSSEALYPVNGTSQNVVKLPMFCHIVDLLFCMLND
jgi:hypothetical protein